MAFNIPCVSSKKYDKLVAVHAPPTQPNDFGEVDTHDVTKWPKIGSIYCTVRTGTAREVWKAREQNSQVTAVFETPYTRFSKDLTGRHMLKINGRNYYVVGAQDKDEDNVEMVIWCGAELSR